MTSKCAAEQLLTLLPNPLLLPSVLVTLNQARIFHCGIVISFRALVSVWASDIPSDSCD